MAKEFGISHASVQRIWAEHGQKPDLVESFKVANDRASAAKLEGIAGLHLNTPENALALAVDAKSQIQALDLTQPGLLKRGRAATMTHDDKRNGTTTLPGLPKDSALDAAIFDNSPRDPRAFDALRSGARSSALVWPAMGQTILRQ